jgi:hypothetical protein
VIILGGLTSVPGAIIGGLIIGVGEKLSEVYPRPVCRRRHRDLVCLCAGAGVPAVPAAGPVRRENHRPRLREERLTMFYRENGQFKTTYRADQQIFPIAQDRWAMLAAGHRFAFMGCRCWHRLHVPRDPDSLS